jgi:hypothetical protein
VLDLADRLRDGGFDTPAETLESADASGRSAIALTVADREAIRRVLDDPPEGLAELRGVLLREHEWRGRVGLTQASDALLMSLLLRPLAPTHHSAA